jgi:phosphoribosyl 1,2-cyclic phosphate phosphodiesterase
MLVTFLGTGTSGGVPVVGCRCLVCQSKDKRDKRLRSSVMIEEDGMNILIDCGPDFRQQMLTYDFEKVDAVLLTHSHRDHIAGLDDMKNLFYKYREKIKIYCTRSVLEELRQIYFYVFSDKRYPGVPQWNIQLIDDTPFHVGHIPVIPVRCLHGNLPVLGFRIGAFAYLTDLNVLPASEFSKLQGLNVLVLDALRDSPHHSHLSLDEAVVLAQEIGAKKTFFTHICHQMPKHAKTIKQLPEAITLSHDGLKISIET